MNIGITAACDVIEGGHGSTTCNKQHWNSCAAKIVQAHGCIGCARIDVNQYGLSTSRCNGIAARHVNRRVFVRAQN